MGDFILAINAARIRQKNRSYCFNNIKNFLIDKFLLDNDVDSINILLNMYNIENSISLIAPSYISIKNLKKDLIHFFRYKVDSELMVNNISSLIHDDINRFELSIYLEGYRGGFCNKEFTNKLECLAFKYLDIQKIYNLKKLFNYEFSNEEILNLKKYVDKELNRDSDLKKQIKNLIYKFDANLLKKKIYVLNSYLDRQIMININSNESKFIDSEKPLNHEELMGLNRKIVKFLFKDALKVYKIGFWDGVNDRVLKRYK